MTVRIGLTGPIGCGKSTVAGWLGERPGVIVIDADQVARQVVEPGQPALEAIVARFGDDLRREDGTLDRAALGRIVFNDPAALRDLEAITHPAVRPRIMAAIGRAEDAMADAVVIEAIRLVEGGLADLCDEVWLIRCDVGSQRDRLKSRGYVESDAAARIEIQADLEGRSRSRATRIVDTSGPPEVARQLVEHMIALALRA